MILEDATNELTDSSRELFFELLEELKEMDKQIAEYTKKIQQIYDKDETCQRIGKVEGVGPITATAMVAAVSDPREFKNGRQLSAWLGLVPRQNSSGGKTTLLGISKRGNKYVRTLLIHGARSVLLKCGNKKDRRSLWLLQKEKTRGFNRARGDKHKPHKQAGYMAASLPTMLSTKIRPCKPDGSIYGQAQFEDTHRKP